MAARNRDIWRGFLDMGGTSEMNVTYSRGPWELCTTTIFEFAPLGDHHQAEVDFAATRRFSLRKNWTLALGYDYYGTPREIDVHAHEFWSGLEYSGRIDFSVKAFQFAAPHTGSYVSAEVGRNLWRRGRYALRADSSLGFNRHMYIDRSAFSDLAMTITPSAQTRFGGIAPYFTFSKALNRGFGDHFAFGIKVGTRKGGE